MASNTDVVKKLYYNISVLLLSTVHTCNRRRTPRHRQEARNAPVWRLSRLNSHHHTRHDKTVLSVSSLVWQCELLLMCSHFSALTLSDGRQEWHPARNN